jgi:hypothetical protein
MFLCNSIFSFEALLPGINTFQPFTGVEPIWDQIAAHHLELANCSNAQLRNMALESLDHSICSVVGSEKFQGISSAPHHFQEEKVRA